MKTIKLNRVEILNSETSKLICLEFQTFITTDEGEIFAKNPHSVTLPLPQSIFTEIHIDNEGTIETWGNILQEVKNILGFEK